MIFTNWKHVRPFGALIGALLLQLGCSGEEAARGSAVAVDHTTQTLTSAELLSVNGTYDAACRNRSGPWSMEITTGATLDNPGLSVILNDSACVLTMTSLHTSGGIVLAVPAIVLTPASYKATASAFGAPVQFYANAKLSAVDFASNFVLTIPFSNNPSLATGGNTAAFSVVVSTATAQSVAAPNYSLDVSGIFVLTDVNDIIQSVTGAATLTAGSQTGQRYLVVNAAGLNTYATLDAAYTAGTSTAMALSIPAAAFTLAGDLTGSQVRTLIIANVVSAVASYEAFEITFHPAP